MITYLRLSEDVIEKVKTEAVPLVCKTVGNDVKKIILYGSCSRGDFSEDSDIDIALLTSCNRTEVKKYNDSLAEISTEFAERYLAIVNFICLPEKEYEEKKEWYPYYKNIEMEGEVLYESRSNIK